MLIKKTVLLLSKKNIYYIVVFLIGFIPRIIISLNLTPYSVYDEGTTLGMAAYLAGKDWSQDIATHSYYGFGYYALFFPIFKVTNNPYIIYRFITIVNSCVQALIGPIAFNITTKFLGYKKYNTAALLAIISSYLIVVRTIAYNETGIVLCSWLIAWNLCKIIQEKESNKKRYIFCILLVLLLSYSITIHTRNIILPIVIVIFSALYYVIYKEEIFPRWFVPLLILGIGVSKFSISTVQNLLWLTNQGSSLGNATINIGSSISRIDFLNPMTWKAVILIVIGQVNTISMFSVGLFVLGIISAIAYIFKNGIYNLRKTEESKYIFTIFTIFLLATLAMIVGQSITWMFSLVRTFSENLNMENLYAFKAMSYIRYLGAYIGPMILIGLVVIQKNMNLVRKYAIFGVFISVIIHFLWINNVLPLIQNSAVAFEAYIPFSFHKIHEKVNLEAYLNVIGWIHLFLFVLSVSLLIKKMQTYYLLVIVVLIFEFCYTGYYNDRPYAEERSYVAEATYQFVNTLNNVEHNIYTYNTDSHRIQFYLNDYTIIPKLLNDEVDEGLLIYEGELENKLSEIVNLKDKGFYYIELDKKIYVLFKGATYLKEIKQQGYKYQEF